MSSSQRMVNFIRMIHLPVIAAACWYYGFINHDVIAYIVAAYVLIQWSYQIFKAVSAAGNLSSSSRQAALTGRDAPP